MILRNSAICNQCKEEVVSRYQHDYVACSCGAISVDGGLSYLKKSGDCTETSLTSQNSFEEIREGFEWGSRGVDGKEPLSYVKLKDMDISHIKAILDTQKQQPFEIRLVFLKELLNRK
jgi:hypothetical protein